MQRAQGDESEEQEHQLREAKKNSKFSSSSLYCSNQPLKVSIIRSDSGPEQAKRSKTKQINTVIDLNLVKARNTIR